MGGAGLGLVQVQALTIPLVRRVPSAVEVEYVQMVDAICLDLSLLVNAAGLRLSVEDRGRCAAMDTAQTNGATFSTEFSYLSVLAI